MRAVILGGTFNPVHLGHLYIADEVRQNFQFDSVIFIPVNLPAHKAIEDNVKPQQRIAMLARVIEDSPDFLLDSCEIDRGGISYTIDTIRFLKAKYEIEGKPGLIIGDDLADDFSDWKDADLLSREVDIIIAHRKYAEKKFFAFPHKYIDNLILGISSSDIRSRLRAKKTIRFLMPEGVRSYIYKNGLYGSNEK